MLTVYSLSQRVALTVARPLAMPNVEVTGAARFCGVALEWRFSGFLASDSDYGYHVKRPKHVRDHLAPHKINRKEIAEGEHGELWELSQPKAEVLVPAV
jgi:hypothetical protein